MNRANYWTKFQVILLKFSSFYLLSSTLNPSLTKDPSRLTVRVGENNLHEPEEFQVDHEVEKVFIYPSSEGIIIHINSSSSLICY